MNITRLENIRASGNVLRYHTAPLSRAQNVAQHCYGVAMIVLELKPDASAELIRAVLLHDYPELYTGDTPSPSKWRYPELEEALRKAEADLLASVDFPTLTGEERQLLKLADMLEGAMWCVEEAERGSPVGAQIARRFINAAVRRGATDFPGAQALIARLEARLSNGGLASYSLLTEQEQEV
jgi:5'-deoxynucleotidase YfbR-like HD superfamily hydrolase